MPQFRLPAESALLLDKLNALGYELVSTRESAADQMLGFNSNPTDGMAIEKDGRYFTVSTQGTKTEQAVAVIAEATAKLTK